MEDKSNLLVLLLIVMMGTFSLVLIFKGDFQRGIQIAEEEEEQKAEREIARREKAEKYAIEWKPSAPAEPQRAPAVSPPGEVSRGPAITQEIYYADREPLSRTVVENEQGHRMVADELLLSFKAGITEEEIGNLEKQYQLKLISYLPTIGLSRFQTAAGADLNQLKEQISKENANIRYSEENYVATLGVLPNDAADAWFFENRSTTTRKFGDKNIKATAGIDVGHGVFAQNVFNPPTPECALVAVIDSSFNAINHPEFNAFEAGSKTFSPEPANSGSPNPASLNLLDRLTPAHRNQLAAKNNEVSKILQNAQAPLGLFELIRDNHPQAEIDQKNKELNDKFGPFSSLHSDLTHGIEVASLVSAKQNNGLATAGLCGSGSLRAIQVARLSEDGQGNLGGIIIDSPTTIQGILHAVNQDPPARVINLSLVFDGPTVPNSCTGSDNIPRQVLSPCSIYDAVLEASLKGAVIVASAGNDGQDLKQKPRSPATLSQAIRTVIAVGAVKPGAFDHEDLDRDGNIDEPAPLIAPFSNFSTELVTLGAPGTFIKTPTQLTDAAGRSGVDAELNRIFGTAHIRTKNLFATPITFNQDMRNYSMHEFVDGTSSAAPLVAAVAAMIYKKIEGKAEFVGKPPSDIAATVKTILAQNVQKIDEFKIKFQTGGIVDAVAALAAADGALNAAIAATPPLQIGVAPPPSTGGEGESEFIGIGGCNSIENSSPPWNNLPMIVIFVIPLFLLFRRRLVPGRIRQRSNSRHQR